MATRKVYVLFLQFTPTHQEAGLRLLRKTVDRLFPGHTKKFLVIDNAILDNIEHQIDLDTDLIPGDNSQREFSGWEKGLTWVKVTYDPDSDAIFVLANDTFHRSYGQDYLKLFLPDVCQEMVNKNMIVGYVDAYPNEIELFGLRMERWIRTSFFIVNLRTLGKLLPLTLPYPDEAIFSPDSKLFFSESVPLSENYKQYLKRWLFGQIFEGSPFKEVWHSHCPLTEENFEHFKAKARCILSEHYLSARARHLQIPIYDVRKNEIFLETPSHAGLQKGDSATNLVLDREHDPAGKQYPAKAFTETRLDQEVRAYQDVENVHDLPAIHHYWSEKYLIPKMKSMNIDSIDDFYLTYIIEACQRNSHGLVKIASIGSGNCDLELRLSRLAIEKGVTNFHFDCMDLNPYMLDRGRKLSISQNVGDHLTFIEADLNRWEPKESYSICMAHHSLHHIYDLETLFSNIRSSIGPDGVFLTCDMIGRNGHMRWPEALKVINWIWRLTPNRYRYNHQLKRFEEEYDNWDCSKEGFEGIRSQDILPLLIMSFYFEIFLAFGNLINIFVDRSFGPNFDINNPEDKEFIDHIAHLDDEMIDKGLIKPTQMLAAMRTVPIGIPKVYRHWTPEFCVRWPDTPPPGLLLREVRKSV